MQPVVVTIMGYSNVTAARTDSLSNFPVNSTFSCYAKPDGALFITNQQRLDGGEPLVLCSFTSQQTCAALAVFVIGCVVAASFAFVALGTFVFAHVSMRKDVPSCWKRSKAWKEWWWMAIPHSSDDEHQPEEAAATAAPQLPAPAGSNDFDQPSDIIEL